MSKDRAAVAREIIATLGDTHCCAVFLYGSVATGSAVDSSDIDTFVLTDEALPDRSRQRVMSDFLQLQRRLGYVPDPRFPVELFSVAAADDALTLIERMIADGSLCDLPDDADEREILRALAGPRRVVRPGAELVRLTTRAQRVAAELARMHI